MKEPLKLPFVFLFVLICVTLVLTALALFAEWGVTASVPFGIPYLVDHFPGAAFGVLIPSVVITVVLAGFRMARRPFSRLLGFLIVLGTGYIVLVNGMIWLSALSGKMRQQPETAGQYLQPWTFLRLGGAVLAPAMTTDDSLRDILVYMPNAQGNRLTVYPAGSASTQGGYLTVTLAGQPARQLAGEPQAARMSAFATDRVSALFLRDIASLTDDFQSLMKRSLPEFFAACFALVFLCAASFTLLRLTRWPLANIILLLAAVRGYFLLYHALTTRFTAAISSTVSDPFLARLFPSASFVVLGVLLLLIDILFIPARRWSTTEPA